MPFLLFLRKKITSHLSLLLDILEYEHRGKIGLIARFNFMNACTIFYLLNTILLFIYYFY